MLKRELETEQNCNILTPTLMAITAFLSRSPGLLNRGPGGPASLGHVPNFSIFSSTATAQSVPEGPLYCVLVFSAVSYLQLTDFLSLPGLYNCSTSTFFLWASQIALNLTRPWSRLYPDILRPDAPVIYTGAFPILTTWPGSICYTDRYKKSQYNKLQTINKKIQKILRRIKMLYSQTK